MGTRGAALLSPTRAAPDLLRAGQRGHSGRRRASGASDRGGPVRERGGYPLDVGPTKLLMDRKGDESRVPRDGTGELSGRKPGVKDGPETGGADPVPGQAVDERLRIVRRNREDEGACSVAELRERRRDEIRELVQQPPVVSTASRRHLAIGDAAEQEERARRWPARRSVEREVDV